MPAAHGNWPGECPLEAAAGNRPAVPAARQTAAPVAAGAPIAIGPERSLAAAVVVTETVAHHRAAEPQVQAAAIAPGKAGAGSIPVEPVPPVPALAALVYQVAVRRQAARSTPAWPAAPPSPRLPLPSGSATATAPPIPALAPRRIWIPPVDPPWGSAPVTPVRLTPVLHRRSHQPAPDLPHAPPGLPPRREARTPISRHQVRRLRAPLHTPPERKSRCPHRPEAQIPPTQQRRWRTSRCRRFHRHRWRVRRPPAQVNAPARAPRPMAPPSARMGRVPVRMRGPAHRRRHARPIPRRVRHVWPRCAAAGRRLSHRRHRPRPRAPTPGAPRLPLLWAARRREAAAPAGHRYRHSPRASGMRNRRSGR
ncbi:Uncharacterised protein [Mycobacteroides abscessus]|nr:Uncharacterised protein [Mycobacteroides abscessus]